MCIIAAYWGYSDWVFQLYTGGVVTVFSLHTGVQSLCILIQSHQSPLVHRQNTQSFHPKYTARIHCLTSPEVHSKNTQQSLHPKYTVRIHSLTSPEVHSQNTQSLHPKYTARLHSHLTPSTLLEYTVTSPQVHSQNTQSLHPKYTARIQSHHPM